MLKDFVSLSAGDSFVQNGANSAVGQAAIQIARRLGLKSINVVRARGSGMDQLKAFLNDLGADLVITGFLNSFDFTVPTYMEILC